MIVSISLQAHAHTEFSPKLKFLQIKILPSGLQRKKVAKELKAQKTYIKTIFKVKRPTSKAFNK
jgi:hypothetical protein